MGLDMGEISKSDVSILEDDSLRLSKGLTLIKPHLEEPPFVEFCGDVVMDTNTHNIKDTDPICNEPLDLTPILSPLLPMTPSNLHAYHVSVGDIRGYNPSFDPYCAYLEDMPRKIIWSTFFNHIFDFSMAFDEFKGHLLCLLCLL